MKGRNLLVINSHLIMSNLLIINRSYIAKPVLLAALTYGLHVNSYSIICLKWHYTVTQHKKLPSGNDS